MKRLIIALSLLFNSISLMASDAPTHSHGQGTNEEGEPPAEHALPSPRGAHDGEAKVSDYRAQIRFMENSMGKMRDEIRKATTNIMRLTDLLASSAYKRPEGMRRVYVYIGSYTKTKHPVLVNIDINANFGQLIQLLKGRGELTLQSGKKFPEFSFQVVSHDGTLTEIKPTDYQTLEPLVRNGASITIRW